MQIILNRLGTHATQHVQKTFGTRSLYHIHVMSGPHRQPAPRQARQRSRGGVLSMLRVNTFLTRSTFFKWFMSDHEAVGGFEFLTLETANARKLF